LTAAPPAGYILNQKFADSRLEADLKFLIFPLCPAPCALCLDNEINRPNNQFLFMDNKKMNQKKDTSSYTKAGVDIDEGNRFVHLIKPIVNKSFKPGVITDIGGFAGLFSLKSQDVKNPVLVASTDGVGTKLKIAFMMDKHDTIGIDLVAMCVNDIIVQGATPLFMLDYIATSKLEVEKAVDIVKGIVEGCKVANCSLIGGETAEMPGFYAPGEYDLAGFVVGLVDNDKLMDGSGIAVGNQLIGISSNGIHSNGYSLVRNIFFEKLKMSVNDHVAEFGRTLGEELLQPTRIYYKTVTNLKKFFKIYGISHITGGGIIDNLPRILPKQCKAMIDPSSWEPQPVFQYMKKAGNLSMTEMMRTFNNGLGLIIVIDEEQCSEALAHLESIGEKAYHIGSLEARKEHEESVQFIS
jgi:phosphoribosylformylglycinamidine cyclo-ligase